MDGAARFITIQLAQQQGFSHNALADKGGIAVQQQAHDLVAIIVGTLVLFRADLAQDDCVHTFQVAGVGGQRQVDRLAFKLAIRRRAQVIFHITGSLY